MSATEHVQQTVDSSINTGNFLGDLAMSSNILLFFVLFVNIFVLLHLLFTDSVSNFLVKKLENYNNFITNLIIKYVKFLNVVRVYTVIVFLIVSIIMLFIVIAWLAKISAVSKIIF